MRLYLDDNSAKTLLVQLLRQARHDVVIPADIGQSGASDAVHLRLAILEQRTFLSQNYRDFEELHDLITAARGHHAGILLVRNDNNPKRDLKTPGVVRAVARLEAAGVPIADELIVLNHWR